jgi:hypothetical protein
VACLVMEGARVLESEWTGLIPKYIQEGREVAARAVGRCRIEKRNFVFLTTDGNEKCLENANAAKGSPGVIHVFRNEAPIPGSRIHVIMPTLLRP